MEKKKGVRTTHPQYDRMQAKWQKCRDFACGEEAVHAATTRYLPKLAEETDADYKARLNRTPLFNATYRTLAGLRGMLFRKPGAVDAPEAMLKHFDDIDMAGTPLDTFAQAVAMESLTVGRIGIMVDHPQRPGEGPLTVAQAVAAGLRPSLQKYPAESIINWKTTRVGNATVLSLVVLCEQAPSAADGFGHDSEPRWRVLDLFEGKYRQRLFKIDAKGDDEQIGADIFPLLAGVPMTFIPFVFIGADRVGPDVEDPPLIDLVDMNAHHYQVSADYEHGCHFSGLPTLFISGYSPQVADPGQPVTKIYIGGPTANCLPSPDAKAYIVEVEGDFAALRANLNNKEAQMAVLGARMLEAQKAAAETAETTGQHRKGEESLLSSMGKTISLGLKQALDWFALWSGSTDEVVFALNTDFTPIGMSAQELTALVGAWQAGAISEQTLFENLQRHEVIAADTKFEEDQARKANKTPSLAGGLE